MAGASVWIVKKEKSMGTLFIIIEMYERVIRHVTHYPLDKILIILFIYSFAKISYFFFYKYSVVPAECENFDNFRLERKKKRNQRFKRLRQALPPSHIRRDKYIL